tara:strand:+ start:1927 stop:3165 length:1239 start_codon:yes stop_codon:yes gene_type:complete
MSWIEKTNKDFEITTGDGKKYIPEWMNAIKLLEFNTKNFNFPGVAGTLVDRREPKGSTFDLEFFFQGENHLDVAREFEASSLDKRFWTISHPLYGIINVQPSSLLFDNTKHNVSKITGTVTETITDVNPKALLIPEDKIDEDVEFANDEISTTFENNVSPTSTDINTVKADNEQALENVDQKIENDSDGQEYFNSFNEAQSAISNAAAEPGRAIRKTQAFIMAPARFNQSVKSRLSMLTNNFQNLRKNIEGTATTVSRNKKVFYESQAGTTLNAIALSSSIVFDDNDYKNRPQVIEVIQIILVVFSQYLDDLDSMQLGSGGDPNDYIPSAQSIIQINNLLNFTMSNLFVIGLSARQERFYTTTDETDLISLAHKIYGLKNGDESINELIRNNLFGINQMLKISKDTSVKYYI